MKKIALNIPNEILVKDYLELNSSYKVAKKYGMSATVVKRILKELGVLRTQNVATQNRDNSTASKERTGKRNPNYKHGKNIRRPRDYKINELTKVRNFVFNRDKYTCLYCKKQGNHLHAHHLIPFWVKPDAFLDSDNIVTVCSSCHFSKAHKGNWQHFDIEIISNDLIERYLLSRERLNELAVYLYTEATV